MRKEFTRHGGAFDRGSADKYYGRSFDPHYFVGATYESEKIVVLTDEEVAAYRLGYDSTTNQKDWGR